MSHLSPIPPNHEAPIVDPMPSCRATSYYVAPGKKYDFATSTLCAYEEPDPSVGGPGHFVEFRHRKDVERYERENPDWDGVCYVGPPGGADVLCATVVAQPELVERWRLDYRVVNGRAPKGPTHVLHNLGTGGVKKAGGLPNVISLFAEASRPLIAAVSEAAQHEDSFSLSLALGLRSRVGDDVAAKIVLSGKFYEHYGFTPIDSVLLCDAYDRLSARYGEARARSLLGALSNALPERWKNVLGSAKGTSPEVLRWFAENGDERARRAVAQNTSITPEIATALSRDPSKLVVSAAARNPQTPLEILAGFLESEDAGLAKRAASNTALSRETLAALCFDPRIPVRTGVAMNRAAPPDILEVLSQDADKYVCYYVARNESTPASILSTFVRQDPPYPLDDPGFLTMGAMCNPTTPLEAVAAAVDLGTVQPRGQERFEAEHAQTSPERLRELANSPYPEVRLGVAANENTTPDVLKTLSYGPDEGMRLHIGQNKNLAPRDRIRVLAESTDPDAMIVLAQLAKQYPEHGLVPHPGWVHIEEVLANDRASAIDDSVAVTWPERPRSVHELPGGDARPWNLDEFVSELDKRPVGSGLVAKVIASKHELKLNANYMGNCTAGYGKRIASGKSVILAIVDEEGVTQYNAEIVRNYGAGLRVSQVNSRFNGGQVPESVRTTLDSWAVELSDKVLGPRNPAPPPAHDEVLVG